MAARLLAATLLAAKMLAARLLAARLLAASKAGCKLLSTSFLSRTGSSQPIDRACLVPKSNFTHGVIALSGCNAAGCKDVGCKAVGCKAAGCWLQSGLAARLCFQKVVL